MAPPPRAADLPFPLIACGFSYSPHLVSMRAHRFERSPAPALRLLRMTSHLIVRPLVCIGLLSACQTKKQPQAPTGVAVTGVATPGSQTSSAAPRIPKPTAPPARQEQSVLPPQSLPLSAQVAERLRSSFEVADLEGENIRARKSSAQASAPSLFEEAIILGKLRAFLKTSTASANQSVTFHNGTATLSLSPGINSGTASVLIAKMLSLDGVNEVRASFCE